MPRRSRGSGRRTRWVSFVPHALGAFTTNDSWDSQLMEIADSTGTIPWTDFIGATVIRTIVDYVVDPIFGVMSGTSNPDITQIFHAGFFMTEESIPSQDRWDPNTPHGDFMWRYSWSHMTSARIPLNGVGVSYPVGFVIHDGNVIRADSQVNRRIAEDTAMWSVGHYFERLGGSGVDASLTVGYTGRCLILLP